MKSKSTRPKCRHCGKFFIPDYRNRFHQNYCSEPGCRRASKSASQRRWLHRPQNRDYFRGPMQTQRVQQWRKSNPDYWKKKPIISQMARTAGAQSFGPMQKSCNGRDGPGELLQDVCLSRNPMFIGLLSVVAGSTLQEDIASTIHQLQIQGRKILRQTPSDQCDPKQCLNYGCQRHPAAGGIAGTIDQIWSAAAKTSKGDGRNSDNYISSV